MSLISKSVRVLANYRYQANLAAQVGVSRQTINSIEKVPERRPATPQAERSGRSGGRRQ